MSYPDTENLQTALREFLAAEPECDPDEGLCRSCLAEDLQYALTHPPAGEVQSNG